MGGKSHDHFGIHIRTQKGDEEGDDKQYQYVKGQAGQVSRNNERPQTVNHVAQGICRRYQLKPIIRSPQFSFNRSCSPDIPRIAFFLKRSASCKEDERVIEGGTRLSCLFL